MFKIAPQQVLNSPSRQHGINSDMEQSYRQMAASLIQEIGLQIRVSNICINTAIVYMHRFYAFHSFKIYHRNDIAVASIFLAAKIEDQPREMKIVIRAANKCLGIKPLTIGDSKFVELMNELVFNEKVLLQTIGFDMTIDHPHKHVRKICHMVKANFELTTTSYFLASNCLHLTSMCLLYKPSVIACFSIYLACKWSGWEIPLSAEGKHWYNYVDEMVTIDLLKQLTNEFIAIYEKSPTRLRAMLNSTQSRKLSNILRSLALPKPQNTDKHHKMNAVKNQPLPQLSEKSKNKEQQYRAKRRVSNEKCYSRYKMWLKQQDSSGIVPRTGSKEFKSLLVEKDSNISNIYKIQPINNTTTDDTVPPRPTNNISLGNSRGKSKKSGIMKLTPPKLFKRYLSHFLSVEKDNELELIRAKKKRSESWDGVQLAAPITPDVQKQDVNSTVLPPKHKLNSSISDNSAIKRANGDNYVQGKKQHCHETKKPKLDANDSTVQNKSDNSTKAQLSKDHETDSAIKRANGDNYVQGKKQHCHETKKPKLDANDSTVQNKSDNSTKAQLSKDHETDSAIKRANGDNYVQGKKQHCHETKKPKLDAIDSTVQNKSDNSTKAQLSKDHETDTDFVRNLLRGSVFTKTTFSTLNVVPKEPSIVNNKTGEDGVPSGSGDGNAYEKHDEDMKEHNKNYSKKSTDQKKRKNNKNDDKQKKQIRLMRITSDTEGEQNSDIENNVPINRSINKVLSSNSTHTNTSTSKNHGGNKPPKKLMGGLKIKISKDKLQNYRCDLIK